MSVGRRIAFFPLHIHSLLFAILPLCFIPLRGMSIDFLRIFLDSNGIAEVSQLQGVLMLTMGDSTQKPSKGSYWTTFRTTPFSLFPSEFVCYSRAGVDPYIVSIGKGICEPFPLCYEAKRHLGRQFRIIRMLKALLRHGSGTA